MTWDWFGGGKAEGKRKGDPVKAAESCGDGRAITAEYAKIGKRGLEVSGVMEWWGCDVFEKKFILWRP
jgi:hypothetical protein